MNNAEKAWWELSSDVLQATIAVVEDWELYNPKLYFSEGDPESWS